MFFPVLPSDRPDLRLTRGLNTTRGITPVLFDPLSSPDPIWPFTRPPAATSSSLKPRRAACPHTVFWSPCLWENVAVDGEAAQFTEAARHVLEENKEPAVFLNNPPRSLQLIVIRTHSLTFEAGQRGKSGPCGCDSYFVSLVLRKTVLKFPDLKSGRF